MGNKLMFWTAPNNGNVIRYDLTDDTDTKIITDYDGLMGLALDPSTGDIYFADDNNLCIMISDYAGENISTVHELVDYGIQPFGVDVSPARLAPISFTTTLVPCSSPLPTTSTATSVPPTSLAAILRSFIPLHRRRSLVSSRTRRLHRSGGSKTVALLTVSTLPWTTVASKCSFLTLRTLSGSPLSGILSSSTSLTPWRELYTSSTSPSRRARSRRPRLSPTATNPAWLHTTTSPTKTMLLWRSLQAARTASPTPLVTLRMLLRARHPTQALTGLFLLPVTLLPTASAALMSTPRLPRRPLWHRTKRTWPASSLQPVSQCRSLA